MEVVDRALAVERVEERAAVDDEAQRAQLLFLASVVGLASNEPQRVVIGEHPPWRDTRQTAFSLALVRAPLSDAIAPEEVAGTPRSAGCGMIASHTRRGRLMASACVAASRYQRATDGVQRQQPSGAGRIG